MIASESKATVLIVDDESEIRFTLRGMLEEAGYAVREAESGRTALGEVALRLPDMIILDLGLPDVPGADVLAALRPLCPAPVLILSVFGQEASKVKSLDGGADDYLTKPFGSKELLARVRALLRRAKPASAPGLFIMGAIEVDLAQRRVLRKGQRVNLTVTEFAILQLLIVHRDRVLTHRQILTEVWGSHAEGQTHYLRIYMARLRRKLGFDAGSEEYIQTESGVGYRFVTNPAQPA